MNPRSYPARLRRVIDGDTYLLDIDLGFYTTSSQRIRLRGVNTPEIVGEERASGLAAKDAVTGILTGRDLVITTHKDERSFERWVADVTVQTVGGPRDLATMLLDAGFAVRVTA